MFNMGPSELLLVCVIGLLVLGPKRLPKVAAEIGKWVGRARRTASQLRRQLEREIELSDIEKPDPPSKPGSAAGLLAR
jgi:sec-independent protein translocase protein TatB